MNYNRELDKYMKQREIEFKNEIQQILLRYYSKSVREQKITELREKYMDLIIFKKANKESKPKVQKKIKITKNRIISYKSIK